MRQHRPNNARPLEIRYVSIATLIPRDRNARTHSRKQLRQIAASIRKFGFINPIIIDSQNRIIVGHGRWEAAKLLGLSEVPVILVEDLDEVRLRTYTLADNRLAELAGWDREILALELQELIAFDPDFDLTITGFDTGDIDILLGSSDGAHSDAADEVPPLGETRPVSRSGNLWHLGKHRLLCGDATEAASFERLMGGRRAEMVFIDPPYNTPIDGHVCGSGRIKHREFMMASGEMTAAEFTAFLAIVLKLLVSYTLDGSIHFVCMGWRSVLELLTAGQGVYSELKNLCVWVKDNAGMGSLYRSRHELVFVFKNGKAPHVNNVELGRRGRYRTNVWHYPGANSLHPGRQDELAMHPTVKPVAMVADAMLDCSRRGGIVLDCFAGSGTTLIAAERTGRRAYAMELDPKYVDVAVRRWQIQTGERAVHAESGMSFEATEKERIAESRASADRGPARTKRPGGGHGR